MSWEFAPPYTKPATRWAMECCDGCAATYYETEDSAIRTFIGHAKIGHRARLFAPGSWLEDINAVYVSASPRAAKEQ